MTTPARIRVLALSPIPEEGAGCRVRVSQYVPYLASQGIDVTVSPFFTPEFFKFVYKPGHFVKKVVAVLRLLVRRLAILRELGQYDLVWLYREAIPLGPPWLERAIARRGLPIVYDFDDAIFLPAVSDANRAILFLKDTDRPAKIVAISRHVVVGNDFLGDFARQHNPAVTTLPSVVDTTYFVPRPAGSRREGSRLVVGWIGSPTTYPYLESLAGVLRDVHARHPFTLKVAGAGRPVVLPGLDVEEVQWSMAKEVSLFNTCDVGVYPLTDDDWARGKCGYKAIQFMACGVPVVAAAVGVNREIIRDGENGFLVATPDEWRAKLECVLTDGALRERFARAGRQTIEERYSLRVTAPRLAGIMRAAVEGPS
jgi:glycosyltransferase involved in cell wall biosynthesis